jgi:hypothetical protein
MGLYGHPWLPIPSSGSDLRVTLSKIKINIKKVKVKHSHSLPHLNKHYKSKGADLSRGIWIEVSISFSMINTMNRSGYSKKTGPPRKFKSGTSDKSDSDVEKSIKNLYF